MMLLLENVEYLFFALFLVGVLLVSEDFLKSELERFRIRRGLKSRKRVQRQLYRCEEHVASLLRLMPKSRLSVKSVFLMSGGMFALSFAVTYASMNVIKSLLISTICAAIPYMLLRVRCELIRSTVSVEGEKLVTMLLSSYRINDGNITEALEDIASQKEELPETSGLIYQLLLDLRNCVSAQEIREAAGRFSTSVGTNWSKLLAADIRTAFIQGTNISLSLEELMKQLREASALMEERIRINNESVKLTVVMIPLSFAATVFLAVRQMGIAPSQLVKNQFLDATASTMFFGIIFMFLFNLSLSMLVRHRRIDL